jgi:uncharacterized protein
MMRLLNIFIFSLLITINLYSQEFPKPMVPLRLVNDFTGLLSEQQQIELNNKLLDFNNQTSTQIYVVTYNDLRDYPIGEYGVQLAEKWGIGQKEKNNGILVLVSPENHKITIRTGYGLEGAVPDAICNRLINNVMTPSFKQGNYYAGIDSATNVLMSLTKGEFTADKYMKSSKGGNIPAAAFIIIIFLFVIFSSIFRNKRRFYSPTRSIPWWMLMGSGSSSNSSWGSFSSGSGGFGGFSGGGGGSFGGGGASGGW